MKWSLSRNAQVKGRVWKSSWVYRLESQKKRKVTPPITSSQIITDQKHCIVINYVLCSPNFEDIVIKHPNNIDTCEIEKNYMTPTKNEVHNAYFKQRKRKLTKQMKKNSE